MKVSIIVPAYNAEKYIEKCLNSIIQQTYQNLEIIVLNDGSIDNTVNIVKELAKNDDRIILIDKDNSGTYLTRKLGVLKSSGESIFHADADDFLELNAIEILVDKMVATDANLVIGNHYHIVKGKKRIIKNKLPANQSRIGLVRSLLNNEIKGYVWGRLFRRELLETLDFKVEDLLQEDFLANLHIFLNNEMRIASVNIPVYNYIIHPNSANSSKNPVFIENVIHFNKMVEKILKDSNLNKQLASEFKLYKCRNWVVYARLGGKLARDKKFINNFYKENYTGYARRNLAAYQNLEMLAYRHNYATGQLLTRSFKKLQEVLY